MSRTTIFPRTKLSQKGLNVYAPYIAFSMLIKYFSYLHFLQYFIYRYIMSVYFPTVEPMDIEGEAACSVGPQLVTAEGEQGVGVDVKRTSSHLEDDNRLSSDNGELTDNQEQVVASAHDKFAWTSQNVGFPEEEGRGSIPSEILFSTWVKVVRTSCGYNFPVPIGGAKRTCSANAGSRPTQQPR